MDGFPPITPELIDALDKVFPDRCPDPSLTDRQIWIKVGETGVVRFLKQVLEEQSTNILDREVIQDVLLRREQEI